MNGMLYVRGDQEDYDAWERRGNPGMMMMMMMVLTILMIITFRIDPAYCWIS